MQSNIYKTESICEEQITFEYINNLLSLWKQYYWKLVFQMQTQTMELMTIHVIEICPLLGYYTAYSGNSLLTFGTTYWSHLQGSRNTGFFNT